MKGIFHNNLLKDYYTITKPGIIYGNALTVVAGFFLASNGLINFQLLLITVIGVSLVVGSGCVFNNYIDRDIDKIMERTKNRPSVRGSIKSSVGIFYGSFLGVLGFSLLFLYTNIATVIVTAVGFFVYVVIYSLLLKRTSTHSTIIGSISGAMPLLAGYLAVRGEIDSGVIILFFILALWQMPHFFAIGIYRLGDYKGANIPILPVKRGIHRTKVQMVIYILLFIIATLSLTFYGYTGQIYFYVMFILGLVWLTMCIKGFYIKETEEKIWARKVFLFSIIVLVVFCAVIILPFI